MKKLLFFVGLVLVITACNKQDPAPKTNGNNGSNNSVITNSTITYINDSFTPVVITIKNNTQTINPGSQVLYSGAPGSSSSGTATTSGHTNQGNVVGLVLTFTLNDIFPKSGNLNSNLDIGSDVFFLKIQNKSSVPITRLYVNYLLVAQTVDDIQINNDGLIYSIGYYNAYSNSNVRAESNYNNSYWYWSGFPSLNKVNQSQTIVAN